MKLTNIPFTIGQANGSGIGKYLYFIPSDQIASWPAITDNIQDAREAAQYNGYTGDFKLVKGACWIKIYNTQGEGSMTAEATGERDCKMYVNKVDWRFPKLTPEAASMTNAVVNGEGVIIGWHDGAYRVIGHPFYRTDITPNVATGDAAGSSKGITFHAECPDYKALPTYQGLIVLEGGTTLDASTGFERSTSDAADRGWTQEEYDAAVTLNRNVSATTDKDEVSISTTSGTAETDDVVFSGNDLSAETLVVVTGTGFSCNVQSISASDANADGGKKVTVTFQGTANSEGTLRFVNVTDGIDITVDLAAEITQ